MIHLEAATGAKSTAAAAGTAARSAATEPSTKTAAETAPPAGKGLVPGPRSWQKVAAAEIRIGADFPIALAALDGSPQLPAGDGAGQKLAQCHGQQRVIAKFRVRAVEPVALEPAPYVLQFMQPVSMAFTHAFAIRQGVCGLLQSLSHILQFAYQQIVLGGGGCAGVFV